LSKDREFVLVSFIPPLGISLFDSTGERRFTERLEQKLHAALMEARERLPQRGVLLEAWMMSDDMKVGKGLEFPVVALPGVGHMPRKAT
jgi:hypothetical protein